MASQAPPKGNDHPWHIFCKCDRIFCKNRCFPLCTHDLGGSEFCEIDCDCRYEQNLACCPNVFPSVNLTNCYWNNHHPNVDPYTLMGEVPQKPPVQDGEHSENDVFRALDHHWKVQLGNVFLGGAAL